MVEGTGIVCSGREKAKERSHCSLPLPEKRLQRDGCQPLLSGEVMGYTRKQIQVVPGKV